MISSAAVRDHARNIWCCLQLKSCPAVASSHHVHVCTEACAVLHLKRHMHLAAMDTKLRQGSARTASGAMRRNSAALPAASKAMVPKPPAKSPSQSLSDTSEGIQAELCLQLLYENENLLYLESRHCMIAFSGVVACMQNIPSCCCSKGHAN